jgi:branched-chain amino acid transport system ATP-binding protein
MSEGAVIAEGPPDAVMKDPAVVDAYLGAHQEVDLGVVTGRIEGDAAAAMAALSQETHGNDGKGAK